MRSPPGNLTVGLLAIGLVGASGCVAPDEVATCESAEDYLSVCYFECLAGWDCRRHYREASAQMQETLEYCSKCLAKEADLSCYDCLSPSGESCQYLLEVELGLTCGW